MSAAVADTRRIRLNLPRKSVCLKAPGWSMRRVFTDPMAGSIVLPRSLLLFFVGKAKDRAHRTTRSSVQVLKRFRYQTGIVLRLPYVWQGPPGEPFRRTVSGRGL